MILLLYLATFVAIVIAAFKGVGYRGLYFGLAVFALVGGAVCAWLSNAGADPRLSLAEARGVQFLADYGPPTAFWFFTVTFGAIVGACIYRARPA